MYCARSREELHRLADGDLPQEQAGELRRHVADCERCRREVTGLQQTAHLVGALATVAPPPSLRDRVMHMAAQPRATSGVTCASVRGMLDDYAHGHLPGGQASQIEAHLGACSACSAALARLEQGADALRLLGEVEPPARVRRQVQHALARRSRRVHLRPVFRGVLATAGAAAAAAAVMVVMRGAVAPPMQHDPPVVAEARPAAPAPAAVAAAPETSEPARAVAAESPSAGPGSAVAQAARKSVRTVVGALMGEGTAEADSLRGAPAAAAVTASAESAGTAEPTPARAPIETPASHLVVAHVGPAVEPEAAGDTVSADGAAGREVVTAGMTSAATAPFSEVRRALREQQRSEPLTVRPQQERDRFGSGPIAKWGY